MNKILVSGVRASGQPHIGNYLGAIKQFVELQNQYKCFIFIADLHSLTTDFEPKELRKSSLEIAADYLALGIDPKKTTIFLQSQVPQHTELAWFLNCITPIGELERMTQFKDKAAQQKENINAGLLNYPVLMAADVLLYKADVVPVGEDQIQHLELARIIARKFNNRFGKTFPEPKPLLSESVRVKSLSHPEKKMSKTGDEALLLSDTPEEINKKIKKAVTATDAKGKSEGVDNLLMLLREFGTREQIQHFQSAFEENIIKFSELKEVLAEQISEHFADFRKKRKEFLANTQVLAQILGSGAEEARQIADKNLTEVKEKIGLL